jgi:hypothetical protein
MEEEYPPITWQDRLMRVLKAVGGGFVIIMGTPAPCRRCGVYLPLNELLKSGLTLPHGSSPSYGIDCPLLCCPACVQTLLEAIARQRRLRAYNRLLAREDYRVWTQCERARLAGMEATLTLEEWLPRLKTFGWRCAYCGGPYEVLEHFVPITRGGGTTVRNCVPACRSCNGKKGDRHPDEIGESAGSPATLRKIQAILQQS